METKSLQAVGQRLSEWKRIALFSHARPDGDALGSIGALQRTLNATGKTATAFVYEAPPARYGFLGISPDLQLWTDDAASRAQDNFDGLCILDTCSWKQLEPVEPFLRSTALPRAVIDHHATHDDITGQSADVTYAIAASAASTCQLVAKLCEIMRWPIDATAGEALLAGMTTDTGWFRFSNTDADALRAAATVLDTGVRPDVLYARLYETRTAARLRLKLRVFATLELHADDALATQSLTRKMLDESGAVRSDSEDLVNEPMETQSVCVSLLFSDIDNGRVRVNFRSKSPEVCGRDVDVSALAKQFDGGGHHRAAGAWLEGSIGQVRDIVIPAVIKALKQS